MTGSGKLPQLCCSWVAHKGCQYADFRQGADLPCRAPESKHAICHWRVRVADMPEAQKLEIVHHDRFPGKA